LDSQKRAYDIAKQLFKEDEYELQECMVNLADAHEKAGEKEIADKLFTEFFSNLDGRDELKNSGTSINSRLSRKLSIKTSTRTTISIRRTLPGKDDKKNKDASAIQRVAVTMRARQEFNMAEKLMLQAIKVKKAILGTEVSADIAYMYSELAVTYENGDEVTKAISCIKKQIAIYEELKMTDTLDFVVANIYIAQLHKENG
jgi:tetratricopeptide (TPR) repeat protein